MALPSYTQQISSMYQDNATMSVADCINQATMIMGAIKTWFDDNSVAYTASDLIDATELINEMCEPCD